MSKNKTYSNFSTNAVHAGALHRVGDPSGISVPFSSSWILPESGDGGISEDYGRVGNSVMERLEAQVGKLENSNYCTVFGSGIAALTSVIATLNAGATIVLEQVTYGCTVRLLKFWERFGINVHYLDFSTESSFKEFKKIKPKLVMIESPTNPLVGILDLQKIITASHEIGALVSIDNTFANSYNQRPLDLGADYSVISLSKYHNGHSTAMVGAVCTNNSMLAEQMLFHRKAVGLQPGNLECTLTIQGIQTLGIRMERIANTALIIAEFLANHPKVKNVRYPFHPSHPQYEIAISQMKTGSGVIACELTASLDEIDEVVNKLSPLFIRAHSIGSVKSQVSIPARMSHASMDPEQRRSSGISDGLLRLSIGLEDPEDLIEQLERALG
jgi:cystathionine beta-lyase/cystathionine gamma-synthase